MIRLLFFTGLFISFKTLAGYECELKLSHSEDLYKTVSSKQIIATDTDMKSVFIKDLFIEEKTKKKTVSLAVKAFISGWSGEEEMTLAVFRRKEKKSDADMVLISDKVSLRNNDRDILWFDSYKLEIDCNLN